MSCELVGIRLGQRPCMDLLDRAQQLRKLNGRGRGMTAVAHDHLDVCFPRASRFRALLTTLSGRTAPIRRDETEETVRPCASEAVIGDAVSHQQHRAVFAKRLTRRSEERS